MITVQYGDKRAEIALNDHDGDTLMQVLTAAGYELDAPCGGQCICGACKIHVAPATEPTVAERSLLSRAELAAGTRLACATHAYDGMTVTLDGGRAMQIVTSGVMPQVNADQPGWRLATDIGTTTVVSYLLHDGAIHSVTSGLNAQRIYGADVLSRIQYAVHRDDGLRELCDRIRAQLDTQLDTLCRAANIAVSDVVERVVTANTTMLHLLADVSPAGIGVAPFTPAFTDTRTVDGFTLLGSVSGYVGADVVSGLMAAGVSDSERMCLYIDIGTNGEIALGNRDGLLCCATAAGPAFEGAQIACGTGGVRGAINAVRYENGVYAYTTIEDASPIGITGSGVVDVVAALLQNETIDETGMLDDDVVIADGIYVCPKDVREIQLAKAAIAGGIDTLLHEAGITFADVDTCYVAGGFGHHLNIDSAMTIGLLPKALAGRIVTVGNSAGSGACMYALSGECRDVYERIRDDMRYIELSGHAYFNDRYVMNMYFEERQD